MELTIQVNPHERTVRFREVSSLAAGDVCSVTLDGVRGADLPSLRLALYRDAASASPVASCVSFSAVPGHPNLASGTLGLDTSEMAAWFDDVRPDDESSDDGGPSARTADAAERAARADGWLVVTDRLRTWAACRVPAILRPGAGMSGVPSVDSLALLVEGLVSAAMSGALAGKADKAVPAAAGSLASLDASGNLSDSGATPASIRAAAVAEVVANAPGTMDTLKEIADILGSAQQSGTVLRRISDLESGKVDQVQGKGLSANDYTDADKSKLDGLSPQAQADWEQSDSDEPDFVRNKPTIPVVPTLAAVATSGSYDDLLDKPTIPAPAAVDPSLSRTSENPVQNKAVTAALYGGFTEWEFGGVPSGLTARAEYRGDPSVSPAGYPPHWWRVYLSDGEMADYRGAEDALRLTSEGLIDASAVFPTIQFSAVRRAFSPTKTSQLTNDGDGSAPNAGYVMSNDARLSDARQPTAHRATHAANGSDPLAPADIGAASLADLHYALVEPGKWEFSGSGVQDGVVYAVDVTYNPLGGNYRYVLSADGVYLSEDFESESPAENYVTYNDVHITAMRNHLLDRAGNLVVVTGDTTLALPALANAGKSRDFYLRMTVTGSRQVSFSPTSGMTYTGLGNPSKTYSAGTYVLRFTETSANEFCVTDMLAQIPDVTGKADKVSGATAGNIAALDAQGNLADSGVKASDFAAKADLPYAMVTPGKWEFSDGGTYTMDGPQEAMPGEPDTTYYWTLYQGSTRLDDSISYGSSSVMSVEFPTVQVFATRASLPGHLIDRAVNAVPVSSATEITLPNKIAGGKSRDFYLRMSVSAESAVTFAATDSGGDAVSWDSMGSPAGTFSAGTYLYRFTEVADGVFHAADITDGGSVDPAVLDGKLDATSAAPSFDPTLTYLVGEYVTYGGVLYRCKTAVTTAGAWTGTSNWEVDDMTSPDATLDIMSDGRLRVVTVAGEDLWMQGYDLESTSAQVLKCEKVNLLSFPATTASAFDSTAAYAVGDRVIYGGMVYKFTAAHSAGAWIGTDAALDSVSLTMPYVPVGKVGDFVLDVDNSANASVKMVAELSGLFTAFDVFVDKGRNLSDLLTFDGGEQCELYFTMTAFGTQAKPAWKVVKQVVEKQEAGS